MTIICKWLNVWARIIINFSKAYPPPLLTISINSPTISHSTGLYKALPSPSFPLHIHQAMMIMCSKKHCSHWPGPGSSPTCPQAFHIIHSKHLSATSSSAFSSLLALLCTATRAVFPKHKSDKVSPAPRALWLSVEVPEPQPGSQSQDCLAPPLLPPQLAPGPLLTTGGSSLFLPFPPILPWASPPGVGGVLCLSIVPPITGMCFSCDTEPSGWCAQVCRISNVSLFYKNEIYGYTTMWI